MNKKIIKITKTVENQKKSMQKLRERRVWSFLTCALYSSVHDRRAKKRTAA